MMISSEPFIPHTLAHLTEARAFPSPLPESFYNKLCKDYEAVNDAITKRIIYQSDDLKVTGVTTIPAKTETKNHPILIYNRGGHGEYGKLTLYSIMRSMLPFAQAGYLVYASNYRGNDGGEGKDEFGGADINDILNLLEIAKTNQAWDGKNIFILGHSRGGMMNALSLRQGITANAVISLAAISDLRGWQGKDSSMEKNIFRPYIPNYLTDPLRVLTDRSPICWTDKINAPLLLLHGTNDKAVDISHSINLAKKLKEHGKTHELITYKNDNHALLRHWNEVINKSINWLESYRR